jgi:hypothetical protein
MTLGFPTLLIKIQACIPIDRYKKIGTICVKHTFPRILLALYVTIDSPEINNTHKINQIEQQTKEFQYDDAMTR